MADHVNWDMTPYFEEFGGSAYKAHLESLYAGFANLERKARSLARLTMETLDGWEEFFLAYEGLMEDYSHLASYVSCLSAADADNEDYQAAEAELSVLGAHFTKAMIPCRQALKDADEAVFQALLDRGGLSEASYYLARQRQDALWTMEPELEGLAADLAVDGLAAWGRLYDELSSKLSFDMGPDEHGRPAPTPMARKRTLMEDVDPEVRRKALVNSNKAWEEVAHVAGACLNAIAGTRITLYERRGLSDFLEKPMFDGGVDRSTIETMWDVVEENRGLALDFLKRKAALLGRDRLGFQDLAAPLPPETGAASRRYSWEEGVELMLAAFDERYPALGEFSREMLESGGVESEVRPGKRPGAFCTTSLKTRDSRVFMSYGGSIGDVQTLAHELGHAFHSRVLSTMRPMAARYPMTLAETASTFAERMLQDAILARPDIEPGDRLAMLTARMNDAATFLCDIHMRYLFEQDFYTEREQGVVPVSRLKELMLAAQRRCFGDVLAEEEMDPMFWASKLHFYITGLSFYNYPYTFGYLLSLGLAARAGEEGKDFPPRYEHFLTLTGSRTAEVAVRKSVGANLGGPYFWRGSMELIRRDLEDFLSLVP